MLRENGTYEERRRGYCPACRRPPLTCYCRLVEPFDPGIVFAILIHGREAQKRIATGRLAHRCLRGSLLLEGYDYSNDARVNALLADERYHPVVLYPGPGSVNLTTMEEGARADLRPAGKQLLVFVIDGTWITARKTMQRSRNLSALPQICFDPRRASRFRVRKQPQENFLSTIEAIHETLELLGPRPGFDPASRAHDGLLRAFDAVVEQQIDLSSGPALYCQWSPRKRPRGTFES